MFNPTLSLINTTCHIIETKAIMIHAKPLKKRPNVNVTRNMHVETSPQQNIHCANADMTYPNASMIYPKVSMTRPNYNVIRFISKEQDKNEGGHSVSSITSLHQAIYRATKYPTHIASTLSSPSSSPSYRKAVHWACQRAYNPLPL
jgi:hypothetical protein